MAETNWAGNHTDHARVERVRSLEHLQEVVAAAPRVRALGSRHSFTDLTDITDVDDGVLVSMTDLPMVVEVDPAARTARVTGWTAYGAVGTQLQAEGWALGNLASLPHISVAGAALGALGVVTSVTLDVEPSYDVRQAVYAGLPWDALEEDLDVVLSSAYSVSLFTRWGDAVEQVWLKSRGREVPAELFGAPVAGPTLHMLAGGDPKPRGRAAERVPPAARPRMAGGRGAARAAGAPRARAAGQRGTHRRGGRPLAQQLLRARRRGAALHLDPRP